MNSKRIQKEQGQVVIIFTLFFVAISVIVIIGVINPILSGNNSSKAFMKSKEAFILANSASEEALYKLKKGKQLASSETITLNGQTAEITVADTGSGKTLNISSIVDEFERNLIVEVSKGDGISFNYGLQVGTGGFLMGGGAGVEGNVYSNGDILGNGGPYITGSAVAANISDPNAVISHAGTIPPPEAVEFGGHMTWNDGRPEDAAQSFQVNEATDVASLKLYIKKEAEKWMNNITVRLTTDNGGKPRKTTLATATLSASQITTSYNYLSTPLSSTVSLSANTTYWLVFDTSYSWDTFYSIGSSQDTYSDGLALTGKWANNNGGSWNNTNPVGLDMYFDIFAEGDTGLIQGIIIGDDAWAHEINNSTISGDIFCQAAQGNYDENGIALACDTSRPDPAQQPFPISEGNILDWKSQAEAGGITNGDINVGGADIVYLGPQKIVGDLDVGAGGTLIVTGPLWVTGNIDLGGGGQVRLSSSYGEGTSEKIVTDGVVDVTGGGQFDGSGEDESYLLVVTTSACPDGCGTTPAIDASGGTGSVVLNAQKGRIRLSGGAVAKQLTADTIEMTGGTIVQYEQGLENINFSSGPSGSWNIERWEEI